MPPPALNPGPRLSALLEDGESVGAVAELRAWGSALGRHRDGHLQLAPRMVALASDRRLLMIEIGRGRRAAIGRVSALYYAELGAIRVETVPRRRGGTAAQVTVVDTHGHFVELGARDLTEARALVDHVAGHLLEVAWRREVMWA